MELKEVFEPIINFMKSFQKKDGKDISKQAAKDRLKLVLMQDRASVSPDFFEMMKKEIIDVIKKYIEIDEESLEVQLTRGYEAGLEGPALYANIPIKNIKPVASGDDDTIVAHDDLDKLTDAIADEILEEAKQKVEKVTSDVVSEENLSSECLKNSVNIATDQIVDNIEVTAQEFEDVIKDNDITSKDVGCIAENVANEMKKSLKVAKSTTRTTAKATTKKTTTTRKSTKKSTIAE